MELVSDKFAGNILKSYSFSEFNKFIPILTDKELNLHIQSAYKNLDFSRHSVSYIIYLDELVSRHNLNNSLAGKDLLPISDLDSKQEQALKINELMYTGERFDLEFFLQKKGNSAPIKIGNVPLINTNGYVSVENNCMLAIKPTVSSFVLGKDYLLVTRLTSPTDNTYNPPDYVNLWGQWYADISILEIEAVNTSMQGINQWSSH